MAFTGKPTNPNELILWNGTEFFSGKLTGDNIDSSSATTIQIDGYFIGTGFGVNNGTTIPTIVSGVGAPTNAAPTGSVFLRTDGTGSTGLYTYQSGTWTPVGSGGGGFTAGGDLSGSSTDQTVIAIQGNAIKSGILSSIDDGYVLTWVNADSEWEAKPVTAVASVTMGGDISGNSSSATVVKVDGVSYPASPSTNTVPVVTGSNVVTYQQIADAEISSIAAITVSKLASGSAAQVLLNNNTPTPTWTSISGDVSITSTGSTTVAKIDGYALPSPTPGVLEEVGGTLQWGTVNLASSTYVSGVLPTANQASQTMGGDISGTTASATVIKLQGNAIQSGALGSVDDGYVLTWVNTDNQWEPKPIVAATFVVMGGDISGNSSSATVINVHGVSYPASPSTNTVPVVTGSNTVTYEQLADAQISSVAAIAVSKLAAGTSAQILLNNSTPTPTWTSMSGDISISSTGATIVAELDGYSLPSPTPGVLEEVGGALQWGAINLASSIYVSGVLPTANQANQTLGGDLSGTTASATVTKLRGNAVQSGTLGSIDDGYALIWVNTDNQWEAKPIFLSGDVSGYTTATTVVAIQNIPVEKATPNDGDVLTYRVDFGQWEPVAPASGFTAGGDLSGSSTNQTVIAIDGYSLPNPGQHQGVLQSASNGTLTWSAVNLASSSYVSGNLSVSNIAPGTSAQVLMSNGSPATTWTTLSGDVTIGATGTTTVSSIHSATVPAAGSLTTGNVLQVSGSSSLTYGAVNLAGGSNYVTGVLPAANQAAQSAGRLFSLMGC